MAGWYGLEKILNEDCEAVKIDKQIEIVKLIQRIFDNCSEKEIHVGGECYDSKLELEDICRAIERTLEDLVNEKLREV